MLRTSIKTVLLLLTLLSLLTACGGGGSSASSSPKNISGVVIKGPVTNAQVNIYQVTSTGTQGSAIAGPFTTDAKGNWTGSIPANTATPYMVVATGGTYMDEATMTSAAAGTLSTIVNSATQTSIPVTPITDAFAKSVADGITNDPSRTLADSITSASNAYTKTFGFDPISTIPTNPFNPDVNASTNAKAYAAILGGFSTMLQDPALSTVSTASSSSDMVAAVSTDLSDLQLDGNSFGTPVTVGSTTSTLPALSTGSLSALDTSTATYASTNTALGTPITTSVNTAPTGGGTVLLDRFPVYFGSVDCYLHLTYIQLGGPSTTAGNALWNVFSRKYECSGTNVGTLISMTATVDGIDQTAQISSVLDPTAIHLTNIFAAPVLGTSGVGLGKVHTFQVTMSAPGGSYVIDSGEYGCTQYDSNGNSTCYSAYGGKTLAATEVSAITAGGGTSGGQSLTLTGSTFPATLSGLNPILSLDSTIQNSGSCPSTTYIRDYMDSTYSTQASINYTVYGSTCVNANEEDLYIYFADSITRIFEVNGVTSLGSYSICYLAGTNYWGIPACSTFGISISRTAGTISFSNTPIIEFGTTNTGTINGSLSGFTPF